MELNSKIFSVNGKDLTYEDLLKKIYLNSEDKNNQIVKIVEHLQSLVRNSGDASVMAPWIAEYLTTAVRNDDNLIKMASLISRSISKNNKKSEVEDYGLPEDVKRQILAEAEEILKK